MTEPVVVEIKQEPEVKEVPVVVQADPYEEQAREQNWVSKQEWVDSGKAADEWRPAKEFVERGELYKSIHTTRRELKQTQAALDALQRHHRYVFEKAHKQAVDDLKLEKRAAMKEQDLEAVDAIETEIDKLKDEHARVSQVMVQEQTRAAQSGPPPEFTAFVGKNPWYLSDKEMRIEADALGQAFMSNGGNPQELLQYVETKIKQRYPEKFGTRRGAPNAVAPSARTGNTKTDTVELDETEREIMNTFVRQGVMTKEQYKAELKKVKERS